MLVIAQHGATSVIIGAGPKRVVAGKSRVTSPVIFTGATVVMIAATQVAKLALLVVGAHAIGF